MEGTWALGGLSNQPSTGRLILADSELRTSVVRKALRPGESDATRESSLVGDVKCLPTRCDFSI
jgi:hypothetical protein